MTWRMYHGAEVPDRSGWNLRTSSQTIANRWLTDLQNGGTRETVCPGGWFDGSPRAPALRHNYYVIMDDDSTTAGVRWEVFPPGRAPSGGQYLRGSEDSCIGWAATLNAGGSLSNLTWFNSAGDVYHTVTIVGTTLDGEVRYTRVKPRPRAKYLVVPVEMVPVGSRAAMWDGNTASTWITARRCARTLNSGEATYLNWRPKVDSDTHNLARGSPTIIRSLAPDIEWKPGDP